MDANATQFTDSRNGKVYNIVKIGKQVWMVENLAIKVENVTYSYNNKENNVEKYGLLYTWEAAKNACPEGWELPSRYDFEVLLGNFGKEYITIGKQRKAAAEKLIFGGGSEFEAILGGYRDEGMSYWEKESSANFWTSSNGGGVGALKGPDQFTISGGKAKFGNKNPEAALSVRCIKSK